MSPRYETFPIRGEFTAFLEKNRRTVDDVAQEITDTYTEVARNGGRIVAGHVIPGFSGAIEPNCLMLVAEFEGYQPYPGLSEADGQPQEA